MLRASQLSKAITVAVVSLVIGFSLAFSYLLFQLSGEMGTAAGFFSSAGTLMYLSIEGVFLAVVIAGAYSVLRKKD